LGFANRAPASTGTPTESSLPFVDVIGSRLWVPDCRSLNAFHKATVSDHRFVHTTIESPTIESPRRSP